MCPWRGSGQSMRLSSQLQAVTASFPSSTPSFPREQRLAPNQVGDPGEEHFHPEGSPPKRESRGLGRHTPDPDPGSPTRDATSLFGKGPRRGLRKSPKPLPLQFCPLLEVAVPSGKDKQGRGQGTEGSPGSVKVRRFILT